MDVKNERYMLVHRDTIYRGAKNRSNLEESESRCCIIIGNDLYPYSMYLEIYIDKIYDIHTHIAAAKFYLFKIISIFSTFAIYA